VRAEISKPNTTIGNSHSCGDKRCKCCRHNQHSSSYTSKVTGKQYTIFCTVNCKSANVIYFLECSVCGLQYVGGSQQHFHKPLNGHRSDLTKNPIVVLGFEISARTNRFLRLFGSLKAIMGGSGRTLDSLEFFSTDVRRMVLKHRKVYYPQIYTPNLLTPINACCLAAVIFLM
jgi:hypothetical protein